MCSILRKLTGRQLQGIAPHHRELSGPLGISGRSSVHCIFDDFGTCGIDLQKRRGVPARTLALIGQKQCLLRSTEKHCRPNLMLITEMLDRHNSRGCKTGIECLRQAPNQRQSVLENAVPCADSGVPSRHRGLGILCVPRSQPACSIEGFAGPTI